MSNRIGQRDHRHERRSRCGSERFHHADNHSYLRLSSPATWFHTECKRMMVYAASPEPETISLPSGRNVSVGGEIFQLSIDPATGERLVVSYEYSELIAVFLVRPQAGVVVNQDGWILHSGYIRGPYWADKPTFSEPDGESKHDPHAVCMLFAPQFSRGALLAIAWENGALTFVPFCFMSEKAVRERGGSAEGFRAIGTSAPGFGGGLGRDLTARNGTGFEW